MNRLLIKCAHTDPSHRKHKAPMYSLQRVSTFYSTTQVIIDCRMGSLTVNIPSPMNNSFANTQKAHCDVWSGCKTGGVCMCLHVMERKKEEEGIVAPSQRLADEHLFVFCLLSVSASCKHYARVLCQRGPSPPCQSTQPSTQDVSWQAV